MATSELSLGADLTGNPILKKLDIDKKLKGMGIKRCGNDAFRHMNATVMDEIGTPLKTRQHRLAHAQIETTMTHYTHKVDADDRSAAEAIASMLIPVAHSIMWVNFGPRLDPEADNSRFEKLLSY